MTEQGLYERLGGVNAIAMVVDRFSDTIVENPKLDVNPRLREWNGKGLLPGLKFMRTLSLCAVAGGPFQYTGKELHEAHKDLRITSEESTRWERRSPARSTPSRCRSVKSRKSSPPSSHIRPRWLTRNCSGPAPGLRSAQATVKKAQAHQGLVDGHWVAKVAEPGPVPRGGVPCDLDARSSLCSSWPR